MSNKYVDFVSDEDFERAVKRVINAYDEYEKELNEIKPIDILLDKNRQTIDEFKTIFDLCANDIPLKKWTEKEVRRQIDKNINNKIGEFHQELLGYVEGWTDLGRGDELGIDLKKEDNSVFVELKNKYNTLNSNSAPQTFLKLESALIKHPNAVSYLAMIVTRNYKSEEGIWEYKQNKDERIRRISGDKLYELVTGDKYALEKVLKAIPLAIKNIRNLENECISKEDNEILEEYLNHVFKK